MKLDFGRVNICAEDTHMTRYRRLEAPSSFLNGLFGAVEDLPAVCLALSDDLAKLLKRILKALVQQKTARSLTTTAKAF